MPKKIAALGAAFLACCWALPVAAQDAVAQFYRGKTVTIIVGSDGRRRLRYLRAVASALFREVYSRPADRHRHQHGWSRQRNCGGLCRARGTEGRYLHRRDNPNQPLDPILEDAADLNYDPSRMNYLGSAASDETLCIVRPDAPATTFDDMFKTQVIMGGVAANVPMGYVPIVLNNLLGTKFKVVFGYSGSRDIILAIQRGEIHGMCGIGWTSLMPIYGHDR